MSRDVNILRDRRLSKGSQCKTWELMLYTKNLALEVTRMWYYVSSVLSTLMHSPGRFTDLRWQQTSLSAGATICQHAFLDSAPRLSQRTAVGCHSSRGTLWWQAFQRPNPGRHTPCGTSLSACLGGVLAGVYSCCVVGSRLEAPTAECVRGRVRSRQALALYNQVSAVCRETSKRTETNETHRWLHSWGFYFLVHLWHFSIENFYLAM